jgi:ribonuclease T
VVTPAQDGEAGLTPKTRPQEGEATIAVQETYISVDVEAAGPIPGQYSLLSIGACVVGESQKRFYVELKPISDHFTEQALAVADLSLDKLRLHGDDPAAAMAEFEQWVRSVTPSGARPVFVAFNAAFDWMFTHYYFVRFLGRDPFGFSALDIKAFYMGMMGTSWTGTSKRRIDHRFLPHRPHTHHALDDAIRQAEAFERMLARARTADTDSRPNLAPDCG